MFVFGILQKNAGVLLFLLFSLRIAPSVALKCYICDSLKNPGCIDLKRYSGIEPEECKINKLTSMDNWLTELYKVAYNPTTHYEPNEYKGPMHCQKVVASKDGEMVTARFCQIGTAQTDPCNIPVDKMKNDPSIKVQSCSICDTEGCNSAPTYFVGMSTMILTLLVKIFY